MVCWQQAKMLYKYRASLHTRMRTHTPPDEQNQSSGTAELRLTRRQGQRATGPGGDMPAAQVWALLGLPREHGDVVGFLEPPDSLGSRTPPRLTALAH